MNQLQMTVGSAFQGRNNNLTLLRMVAAFLVILGHAHNITTGELDPLAKLTNEQVTMGQIAVLLFFFYGGFLNMKSAESKRKAGSFFRARAIRIFPLLWIVVVLCILVLGPLMTILPISEFLGSSQTWKYLLNCCLIPVHDLPGVFIHNTMNATVNGSLWTLPVEFACYVFCFGLWALRLATPKKMVWTAPVMCAGAAIGWIVLRPVLVFQSAVLPVTIFYVGMLCYVFRDKIILNGYVAAAAFGMLVISVIFRFYMVMVCIAYPYVLLYLAFGTRHKAAGLCGKLDLSYAVYLVAFPIQQVLNCKFPMMKPVMNFLIASAVSLCFSIPLTKMDSTISCILTKSGTEVRKRTSQEK